jgi:hypothetical protein
MSTTKIWLSLNTWNKTPLNTLWKLPIMWDEKKSEFIYISNTRQKLMWYFGIYVIVFMGGVWSSLFVVFRKLFLFGTDTTPPFPVTLNTGMAILGSSGTLFSVIIILRGEELCTGFQLLKQLTEKLQDGG